MDYFYSAFPISFGNLHRSSLRRSGYLLNILMKISLLLEITREFKGSHARYFSFSRIADD